MDTENTRHKSSLLLPLADPGPSKVCKVPSVEGVPSMVLTQGECATRCAFGSHDHLPVVADRSSIVSNGQMVILPPDSELSEIRKLKRRIGKGHAALQATFVESIAKANAVGADIAALRHLVGRGKWCQTLEELASRYGVSRRTAQLYMRINASWQMIESAISSGELCEASLRRVQQFLSKGVVQSENAEWLTPLPIIEAAERVFGTDGITLDPASEPAASNVPAELHYTPEIDGLAAENKWVGSVFLNPPSNSGEVELWLGRLTAEMASGEVEESIVLLPAQTEKLFFRKLVDLSASIVFVTGKLKFAGHKKCAPFSSLVAYAGPRHREFAKAFGPLGSLLRPTSDESGSSQVNT